MSQIILRDLYCEKCTLQFNKKYDFDLHSDLVHGIWEETKVKKKPTIKEEKFEQLQQSEEKIEKPYECNNCSAAFPTKSRLNRHVTSVHVGKKPFQCNICDAKFSMKQQMKRHEDSVHAGKKPFQCNICDAKFSMKQQMKSHEDSVHEGRSLFNAAFVMLALHEIPT